MRQSATVRARVLLISVLLLTALLVVSMTVMVSVIRPTFHTLEREQARDHAALIRNAINRELETLDVLAVDWAAWDDTYAFVADQNKSYQDSNLVAETFTGVDLNLLLIQDTEGRIVWSRTFDLEDSTFVPSETFRSGSDTLARLTALAHRAPDGLQGLVQADRGPMLLSARPILTSQEEGPTRGLLMMGRLLSGGLLHNLEAVTGLSLARWSPSAPDLPPAAAATVAPTAGTPIAVETASGAAIDLFVGLRDVFGAPILVIGSTLPRDISDAGFTAIVSAGVMITLAGGLLIVMFLWSQHVIVIAPLNRLTRHIGAMAQTGDLTETLDMPRHDEMGLLANAFNRMQARISQLAYFDTVTGLPNRLLFRDRADQTLRMARRNGKRVAILFLDLDGFKAINDTRGHSVGDDLLRVIAMELHTLVRESDTVARFGGDEFVMVLPDLDSPGQERDLANRMMARFTLPFRVGSESLFIGASIGVATFPDDGETVEALIAQADAAMYQAKGEGGHRVAFHDRTRQQDAEHLLALDQAFREALVRSQLFLVFQPQVDLRSGEIVGHEALVRWRHPDRGVLNAETFIHIADRSGLFTALDAWVLRAACTALAHAQHAHAQHAQTDAVAAFAASTPEAPPQSPALSRVSVNICARHVEADGLLEMVRSTLQETGADATRLVLEITESVMISRPEAAARVLKGLRALGVRIAIDDFGTGYASLSALHRFPADIVKIDRSFICGLPDDPVASAITRSTITLVTSLGMSVVAEGVETPAQRDFLRDAGCPVAQGYLLGG